MKNRVTELLGCRYPVIQGAMGVICNPEFVAAVSEAGGFGLLATAFAPSTDVVREQIKATKKLTDRPFGLNLFVMNPLAPEFARLNYKNIIVQSKETGTALVDFERFQVRALYTHLVEKLIQADQMDADLFGGKAMEDSWLKGDEEAGILPAGQISGLIGGVLSVREIIEEMVGE